MCIDQKLDLSIQLERFEDYILQSCYHVPGRHNWTREYVDEGDKLRSTYTNSDIQALAIFSYQIKTPGTDFDTYYSRKNVENVFVYYENVTIDIGCKDQSGKNILYEFTGDANDKTYLIRYWTIGNHPLYFHDIALVVPINEPRLFDFYSERIYPGFVSCPENKNLR